MATPPPDIYPLSLHDALPICTEWPARAHRGDCRRPLAPGAPGPRSVGVRARDGTGPRTPTDLSPGAPGASGRRQRSEEHTSELQSHVNLVCRLLLEKKKKKI